MEYTITELSKGIGKSKQSIYTLIKTNAEFKKLVTDNSRMDKKSRLYNAKCLEWLKQYYREEKNEDKTNTEENRAESVDEIAYEAKYKKLKKKVKRLKAEIERLQVENDRLLSMLEKEQEQRQGLLYGLLASKQKLLASEPPKSWWRRLKKSD